MALGLVGCSSDMKGPGDSGSLTALSSEARPLAVKGPEVTAHSRPSAVFRTTPGAGADGVIRGPFPLTVQFNNCQSRPGSEDDNLKFTYDFNGDGTVDEFGHCRWEHTYQDDATARVCVSDRRPENEVCQTWSIVGGRVPDSRSNITRISFTIDSVNCSATVPFQFYLNGVSLGAVMSTGPCVCSDPANVGTYTFSSGAALAAWNNGGSNTIRFVNSGSFTTAAAVSYMNIEVTRANGTTLTSCVDSDGVTPCAGVSACSDPPYATSPVDISTVIVDN